MTFNHSDAHYTNQVNGAHSSACVPRLEHNKRLDPSTIVPLFRDRIRSTDQNLKAGAIVSQPNPHVLLGAGAPEAFDRLTP